MLPPSLGLHPEGDVV